MRKAPKKPNQDATRLRAEAETQLAQKSAGNGTARSADAQLHELQVYQVELEMQNEALRQAQVDLEKSRDRYINLYEFAPVAYLSVSNEGLIIDINLTGQSLFGAERSKLLQRRFDRFVNPADDKRWRNWFEQMKQPTTGQSIELLLQRADASPFYARIEGRTLLQDEQTPIMRIAISDISERKEGEIALAQYKDRLEDLVAVRTADLRATEARISHFSRLTATLSAVNQAIVFNSSLEEVFTAACRACVLQGGYKLAWIGLVDDSGQRIEIRYFYGQALGFLQDMRIDARADHPEGRGPSAIAFREQRTYLCNDFFADPATLPWRESAERYGIRASIALPISFDGVPRGVLAAYGEQPDSFDSDAERVLEEIAHTLSFAIRHFADAAEKRANAAALVESEALLQEAQKTAALGHWTYVPASQTVSWSAQVFRLFGRDPAQLPTNLDALTRCYLPSCARQLEQAIAQVMSSGERIELELQLLLPNKHIAYHALALIPRYDSQGQTISLYGTIQDITEHKRTEQKLLHLAEQLVETANEVADLYQNAPCGYHSLDRSGVFCLMNDTELEWLGYTHDEIIGKKNVTEVLNPPSLPIFRTHWLRFIETGFLRDVELEFVRKDGTIMPVMISATAIRDKQGAFVMSRSTVYDMTERRKMERERAEYEQRRAELSRHLVAVQEAARRQLSGELHDRTSPNLAAIDINFGIIARELPADRFPDLAARLEDMRALIKDTSASIREICADLRPPVLDYAGLPAALETYAHQFAGRTGIAVNLTCSNPARRLAPDTESLLFRIAQESLTNCAKHAHPTCIELTLNNSGSPIELSVNDNGSGFLPDALGKTGLDCGLGILNMREMAEFAGGKFTIESSPGHGTRIKVAIP